MTLNNNEWQRVTKNDNEWITASDKTNENEWEQVK